MRYNKRKKMKNGVCICVIHGLHRHAQEQYERVHVCSHEDVHICEDTKRSPPPPQQWEEKKEEIPNIYLGYKLGAVSITMYINSHTSF